MLINAEKFVEKAVSVGGDRVFHNHTPEFSVGPEGFAKIVMMAWEISEKAQFEIDQVIHSPLPAAEEDEESG